jgi:c-di-GMP-related signal transduction protein
VQYMARQPILDGNEHTAGYELLYRAAAENFAKISDTDTASRSVLEQIIILGCKELSGGQRLYVNCSTEVLVHEYISVLPADAIVVEILETVEPTPAVITACEHLKAAGFVIALDDFVPGPRTLPLLPFADIIKVDFRSTNERGRKEIVDKYCKGLQPLAEKVETRAEYMSARKAGYNLFQGYFFCEPVLLVNHELSPSRLNYLRLMEQTCREEMELRKVEDIIKSDAALCYRLLRYLNSYAFCLRTPITSIRHALSLLGETQVRRWISVACVSVAAEKSAQCLLATALLRARLGELLAPKTKSQSYELFVLGLFSVMDSILGIPLSQVLSRVKVPKETEAALTGKSNRLRDILDLIISYDRGDWEKTCAICKKLYLDPNELQGDYMRALQWVDATMGMSTSPEPAGAMPPPSSPAMAGNGLQTV